MEIVYEWSPLVDSRNWAWVTVGEVAKIIGGGTPSTLIEFFWHKRCHYLYVDILVFNILILCCKIEPSYHLSLMHLYVSFFSFFVIAAFIIKVFAYYLNYSESGVICVTVVVCFLTHVYGWFLYFRKINFLEIDCCHLILSVHIWYISLIKPVQ